MPTLVYRGAHLLTQDPTLGELLGDNPFDSNARVNH